MTSKLTFSGHESFICKQFWLKKGYEFLKKHKKFNADDAVVELGVGKNMVNSIRFWLKSFGLLDESDNLNALAKFLFGDKGRDPFIEDFGTIWLLHYYLINTNRASIYNIVFDEFRKERFEFTRNQLHNFLKRKCEEYDFNYNENTINSDIKVFLKSYIKPIEGKIEIEDDFVGLLFDLDIVKHYKAKDLDYNNLIDWYKIDNDERSELPYQVVLHAILDNPSYGNSVSFKELQIGNNSPCMVFAMNEEGLFNKIKQITERYNQIIFTETAGNQILQFNSNDHLGIKDYNKQNNPYYNISCVYDYLIHNYYSFLFTKYNPHYSQWAAIRTAIERAEGVLNNNIDDALKLIKTIGLLNIFAAASAKIDLNFLCKYGKHSLGIKTPEKIISTLESYKTILLLPVRVSTVTPTLLILHLLLYLLFSKIFNLLVPVY